MPASDFNAKRAPVRRSNAPGTSERSGFWPSNLGLDLHYAGRQAESEAALKHVLEMRPEFTGAHVALGRVYLTQSRPQQALDEILKEKEPVFRLSGAPLGYYAVGRTAESNAALNELIAKFQNDAAFQIAEVYSYRGDLNKAFEWLERARTQSDGGRDPLLRPLESDARDIRRF